jgi:FAD synthase
MGLIFSLSVVNWIVFLKKTRGGGSKVYTTKGTPKLFARLHFQVLVLEPIRCNSGKVISSSRIRFLIMQNMLAQAEQLLGWKNQ